jgi:hypothetical protein
MNENNFLTKNAPLSHLEGSNYELFTDNFNYTMNLIDPKKIITKDENNITHQSSVPKWPWYQFLDCYFS